MVDDAILIVGAGPTGLTLANDLALRDVPFKIIDARAGPSSDSKGLALNISSQYGLQLIGMGRSVGASGMSISRLNLYWEGRRYSSINFGHLNQNIQGLITQPQSISEAELIAQLAVTGHSVCWSHKLIHLKEESDRLYATITRPSGAKDVQSFSFVVGCDGKFSETRKHLKTSFSGTDYNMYFVLGDFDLNIKLPNNEVHYFVYHDTFFILVPISSETWRIVVKHNGAVPDTQVSASEIENIVHRHFGGDLRIGSPKWISRAPFYNRVSGRIGRGRLFIAGDAAHLFSPIGGTGMNTGIQDALNLGWKLAYVHKGISETSLLGTYETERLPAINEAANLSDVSTQLITRKITQNAVLNNLAPVMANRHHFRATLPYAYSGLGQRLSLREPYKSVASDSSTGKFSFMLFALLDKLRATNNGYSNDAIFCLIDLEKCCSEGVTRDSITRIANVALELPITRIIYHYRRSINGQIVSDLSDREVILRVPDNLSTKLHTGCLIEVVRPDGVIIHETNRFSRKDFDSLIHENFHFTTPVHDLIPEV